MDKKLPLCCGTEKGDCTAGHTRRARRETGIYRAAAKGSSGALPAAAHPHTTEGFGATAALSLAKQTQRGDRADFHIKGMEVLEKEE